MDEGQGRAHGSTRTRFWESSLHVQSLTSIRNATSLTLQHGSNHSPLDIYSWLSEWRVIKCPFHSLPPATHPALQSHTWPDAAILESVDLDHLPPPCLVGCGGLAQGFMTKVEVKEQRCQSGSSICHSNEKGTREIGTENKRQKWNAVHTMVRYCLHRLGYTECGMSNQRQAPAF